MGPFYKNEYFYDPAGNRLAMRESTPAAVEANDVVTAITRYNYWKMSHLLSDTTKRPATPSTTEAYPSGKPKDQLLSEQRFDLVASPAVVTGTVYQYGTYTGTFNQNASTGKRIWKSQASGSNWPYLFTVVLRLIGFRPSCR